MSGQVDSTLYTDYELPQGSDPIYSKLRIKNTFEQFKDIGFDYVFLFDQWSHSVTETCDSFKIITVWQDGDTEYLIEIFESLIYSSSSRIIDCVIQSAEFETSPFKIDIAGGADDTSKSV